LCSLGLAAKSRGLNLEMKRVVRIGCLMLVVLYLGAIVYVALAQDRFLYQPRRESEVELLKLAASRGLHPLRTATDEVCAWQLPNPTASRRLVVFHGGSGFALDRIFYANAFDRLGWEVSFFEYPGFGARPGRPGKSSFLAAAESFVGAQLAGDKRPLYLLGESMGSGTACAISGLSTDDGRQIAGLALVVPYARMAEVAGKRLPFLPINLLLRDKYDNIASLERFRGPLTVVIADHDEVVGPEQGRKVYEHYSGPKHLIILQNHGHADFPTEAMADWWREVSDSLVSSP